MSLLPNETGPGHTVVALGGGHGLASSLRALVVMGVFPIGIVSVADDGGSSGRLREDFGLLPPGDVRKCLLALADSESMLTLALGYRFPSGDLEGHSLGNLLLAGLTEITGDFAEAIAFVGELLGIRGELFPSSSEQLTLVAKVGPDDVRGQVQVMNTIGIEDVFVIPENPDVPAGALDAVRRADLIVVGPGSLFTSVLAVICIPAVRSAIERSSAQKIYVANLRPQQGETAGFDVADHIRALVRHGFVPDVVMIDDTHIELGNALFECRSIGARAVVATLGDDTGQAHRPDLLADALMKLM